MPKLTDPVPCIPWDVRKRIHDDLAEALFEQHGGWYQGYAWDYLSGISGRLCDLEDTIDVSKYVTG